MWTWLAGDRFVQRFELDQVRDRALASPADGSSCWAANPQLWKTVFSLYHIRHFPYHLVQSTQLLQTLDFSFLQIIFHCLSAVAGAPTTGLGAALCPALIKGTT